MKKISFPSIVWVFSVYELCASSWSSIWCVCRIKFFARTNFIATHASLCDFYSCVFSPLHEDLLNMWNFGREIYVHYTVSSSFVIQIQLQMKENAFSYVSVFLWMIIVAFPYWCNGYIYLFEIYHFLVWGHTHLKMSLFWYCSKIIGYDKWWYTVTK